MTSPSTGQCNGCAAGIGLECGLKSVRFGIGANGCNEVEAEAGPAGMVGTVVNGVVDGV